MQFPITGDSSSWLDFWGSYIGAVLSSAIALYILYKQNQQNHIVFITIEQPKLIRNIRV